MQAERFYHKCGYPILVVKRPVGLATETFLIDGNNPFIEGKDGKKSTRVIQRCPECDGSLRAEKLLSKKPDESQDKRPTGYIPGRM
jgi:hypothetical protein